MISAEIISKLLNVCYEKDSAVVCQPMKDYVLFEATSDSSRYISRENAVDLQSPDAYRFSFIRQVFSQSEKQQLSMMENCCTLLMYRLGRRQFNFVEGSINNIKLVRQEDITLFSAMIGKE